MRALLPAALAALPVGAIGALASGALYYWRLIRRRELRRRLEQSNLRALVRLFVAEDRLVNDGVQDYREDEAASSRSQ